MAKNIMEEIKHGRDKAGLTIIFPVLRKKNEKLYYIIMRLRDEYGVDSQIVALMSSERNRIKRL